MIGRRAFLALGVRVAPLVALATPASRILSSPSVQNAEQQAATHPAIVGEFEGAPVYDYAFITRDYDLADNVTGFLLRMPGQTWAQAQRLTQSAIYVAHLEVAEIERLVVGPLGNNIIVATNWLPK